MGSTGSNDIGEPAHRHRFEHGRFHRPQQRVGWRARAKERGSRRRILRLGYFFRRRVRHFLCGEKESARISERWARFNFRRDVDFDETRAFGFRFHRNAHQMSQRQRKADPLAPTRRRAISTTERSADWRPRMARILIATSTRANYNAPSSAKASIGPQHCDSTATCSARQSV